MMLRGMAYHWGRAVVGQGLDLRPPVTPNTHPQHVCEGTWAALQAMCRGVPGDATSLGTPGCGWAGGPQEPPRPLPATLLTGLCDPEMPSPPQPQLPRPGKDRVGGRLNPALDHACVRP